MNSLPADRPVTVEPQSPIKDLLAQRKLTRTMGLIITARMREHVSVLTPLFDQRRVLGEHIQGTAGERVKAADTNFKELQGAYDSIATAAPFHLAKGLKGPLIPMTSTLELAPWDYVQEVSGQGGRKRLTVTSPYKAVLIYSGYSPRRLPELLTERARNNGELQQFVLHYLAMNLVVAKQPGLSNLFETLHFPLQAGRLNGFGPLPVICIASSISTTLPSDDLVMQSTELSGTEVFEELVNLDDVHRLKDPFKQQLLDLMQPPAA